jgi:hypothetical protein
MARLCLVRDDPGALSKRLHPDTWFRARLPRQLLERGEGHWHAADLLRARPLGLLSSICGHLRMESREFGLLGPSPAPVPDAPSQASALRAFTSAQAGGLTTAAHAASPLAQRSWAASHATGQRAGFARRAQAASCEKTLCRLPAICAQPLHPSPLAMSGAVAPGCFRRLVPWHLTTTCSRQ